MHDSHAGFLEVHGHGPYTHSAAFKISSLAYADDTMLLCRTSHTLMGLLHCIQLEAASYGMHRNEPKTKYMCMNAEVPPPPYAFSTIGVNTPEWVNSVIYLGQRIDVSGSGLLTLLKRLALASADLNRLAAFWRKPNIKAK